MEPAVIDFDAPILAGVEHADIAVTETDVAVLAGFARLHRLRRNNVMAGHNHDK